MDDGENSDYNKGSTNKSIVLNTHSFTELEVHCITVEVTSKFKIECENRNNKGKQSLRVSNKRKILFILNRYAE